MATFRANRAGLREYLRSDDVARALEPTAEVIAARARSSARVESAEEAEERNRVPGRFRDSIHVEQHMNPSRVTQRVVADSEGAGAIELRDRTLGTAAG